MKCCEWKWAPIAACVTLILAACGGDDDGGESALDACARLNGTSIPASAIGLPTSGAIVSSTELVPPSGEGATAVGEYCKVLGAIRPVDPNAPDIRFQLNLPTRWNDKMVQMGGGGYNGTVVTGLAQIANAAGPTPLAQGYATGGDDSGHQDPTGGASFALNQEALLNYPGQHIKKMHDVSVNLINSRYGHAPAKFYYAGFSTGGREALTAIQRYPADYDGVIVGSPTLSFTGLRLVGFRIGTAAYGANKGYLNPTKQALLQNAVMTACDMLDGVADGIVSNVSACAALGPQTVASLRCAGGADLGDACLSDANISLVNTIATTLKYNWSAANGWTFYPQYSYLEGADFLNSGLGLGNNATPEIPPTLAGNGYLWGQGYLYGQYFVAQSTSFDPRTLDPVNPGSWLPRILDLSALMDASDPDLSRFMAKGGKVILQHGLADTAITPYSTMHYYNTVVARMGQPAVDSFIRFYTQPGMGHGDGTFLGAWDPLAALDGWASNGVSPGQAVVTSSRPATTGWTRPLCVFPSWPRYNGSGDPKVASSFTCVSSPPLAYIER